MTSLCIFCFSCLMINCVCTNRISRVSVVWKQISATTDPPLTPLLYRSVSPSDNKKKKTQGEKICNYKYLNP